MQTAFAFGRPSDLTVLRDQLRDHFGPVRDVERHDPVSQLVKSSLSGRTRDAVSSAAFERLVARYLDVEKLASAAAEEIEAVISDVTHAENKAIYLRAALRKIRAREGRVSLDFLHDWPVDSAFRWLEDLPGVGTKTAAAILNFSTLRKRAFVVDTHVQRVLQRFGFVGPKASAEEICDAVMAAADGFGADDLYELHWLLKFLGQQICTFDDPDCGGCPLAGSCMKRIRSETTVHRSASKAEYSPQSV